MNLPAHVCDEGCLFQFFVFDRWPVEDDCISLGEPEVGDEPQASDDRFGPIARLDLQALDAFVLDPRQLQGVEQERFIHYCMVGQRIIGG